MPSILFINRVYPPADGATGRVLEHIAVGFVTAGWDVSVLTTASPGESAGAVVREGVTIIRCRTFFSKRSLLSRALGYALMIPALGLRALLLPPADVLVIKTDPPMLLVLGPLLRLLKHSRLIHWAQDLYPEIAEEAGIFHSGGIVAGILRGSSTLSMRCYDLTVAVGRCMAERIKARGIPAERICVIPNSGIERDIVPVEHPVNEFRRRHELEHLFVVEYSGNMGRVHEFTTVLKVAQQLQERGERGILFLFIGSGSCESMLRSDVERRGLLNVRFLPPQPLSQLSESLGTGDLHLVTMKEGMSGFVVPSKFYGIMASGRPTLFIGPSDSEVARIIREHEVGTVIQPGDDQGLMEAIFSYRNVPAKGSAQGQNGRSMILKEDAVSMFCAVAHHELSFRQKVPSL
jgi:glycosyltransferase involved in cell wall biosynthesis